MKNISLLIPILDMTKLNRSREKSTFNQTKKWFLVVVGLILSLVFILCATSTRKLDDTTSNDNNINRNHRQQYPLPTTNKKIHQSSINQAQTHLAQSVGHATTVTSKRSVVGRRKLIASSSSLLDTCLDKLATKCPNSGNMNKESTIFPIVTVFLQTLTNDTGTTRTISRSEKILSAYTTKSLMASSFDNLLTNIASLEAADDDRFSSKKKKQRLELLVMVLSQVNVLVQVMQFYLNVINRSSSRSPVDTTRTTALNCEVYTTTATNTTTTTLLREMIDSLQKATTTMMDDTITMYTSGSDSSLRSDRAIPEDIDSLLVILFFPILFLWGVIYILGSIVMLFLWGVLYILGGIVSIVFSPVLEPFFWFIDNCVNKPNPMCPFRFKLDGISSLLMDVGITGVEMEQLEQCSKIFAATSATSPPPKVRLGRRDRLFLKQYWTNTILKSDTMQSILEQLSRFQNTPSSELFVCEYKLAICETE